MSYTVLGFILIYLGYCVFVGFRYKIILFGFPFYVFLIVNSQSIKKLFYMFFVPFAGFILFSFLTLFRVKFSGIDLGRAEYVGVDEILLGLFADTNILFGVASIINHIIPQEMFVYLSPVYDSFLELIPKIIIGDRNTGQQIYMVLDGLVSDESIQSATTYPYFGEFLNMFGYCGYFIGCIFMGGFVALVNKYLSRILDYDFYIVGVSLVGILFGYYFFSRGYLPQFSKSILFVLTPYIMMSKSYLK